MVILFNVMRTYASGAKNPVSAASILGEIYDFSEKLGFFGLSPTNREFAIAQFIYLSQLGPTQTYGYGVGHPCDLFSVKILNCSVG